MTRAGDDLALTSAVGTAPLSAALGKSAAGGESVTFSLTSPAGTFQSSLGFLLLDLYLSAGPLPVALAPGFHVSAPPIVVGPQLLTMPFEPSFVIPTTLAGVTLMGQGTVLSLAAGNGLYATTAAHLVLLR